MKKRSLRFQITLAVGIIVTLACIILTCNSIYSANRRYAAYLNDMFLPQTAAPPSPDTYEEDTVDENADMIADLNRSFSVQGLGVMALMIVTSILFTWWITGRVLRPLEKLTDTMKTMNDKTLDQPLPAAAGAREVRLLTESFHGMLQRLDQSFQIQRRFAADAAHELKTPLASMKTSLQVLQMDEAPAVEDYEEFIQDTSVSLERLIRTVENLLALAGDQSRQKPEPVPLKELIGHVAADLNGKAMAQGISLTTAGDELTVSGSPTLFYRALYNVVDNAIKYNRPEGTVHISLSREESCAVIRVTDTGTGIPEESMPFIFDPFYRADPSRSQRIEGSGLGLSIVQQILTCYQGTVSVERTSETGSTLALRFPI